LSIMPPTPTPNLVGSGTSLHTATTAAFQTLAGPLTSQMQMGDGCGGASWL
jgi:hypothetical protein